MSLRRCHFINLCVSFEFYSKTLTQPGLFPVMLVNGELNWKIVLNYTALTDALLLDINGVSFHQMPLQSEVNVEGPQNITFGTIMLNRKEVH